MSWYTMGFITGVIMSSKLTRVSMMTGSLRTKRAAEGITIQAMQGVRTGAWAGV